MRLLHIDIETYCELDLVKTGVYAYAQHPSFTILLFAYAYDNEPVTVVDLTKQTLHVNVLNDLINPTVQKIAHHALFEITCLNQYFNLAMDVRQWDCTMIQAYRYGMPGSLKTIGTLLSLSNQKMSAGTQLIHYFSKPCKPTKANKERTRNLPEQAVDKWEMFKRYCQQDVEVERQIYESLPNKTVVPLEQEVYVLDYNINKRGILIDTQLVDQALLMDQQIRQQAMHELQSLTGLHNPNSTIQFKAYLTKQGYEVNSFTKTVAKEMYQTVTNHKIKRAIRLKLLLSKAAVKKYDAMKRAKGEDNRVRGMLQYYGANRSGRWAGRLVQLQNLKKNKINDLSFARQLVKNGDMDTLSLLYDDIPEVLGQLIRTAFIPKTGHKFIIADFSAIEARVIAWLAGEKWRMEVFATHGKIYEASASQMFHVPIDQITKGSILRQKGKIAELALGYGGSVGALISMGALEMGVPEKELSSVVVAWRKANKHIVNLWHQYNDAGIKAIEEHIAVTVGLVTFRFIKNCLCITLPSGRCLVYQKASVVTGKFGQSCIAYQGSDGSHSGWGSVTTFGGKLAENIVQAIARDCLAMAMLRLERAGYAIVGHIHDEVIIEAKKSDRVQAVCDIMGEAIVWAKGLVLRADGYEGEYYYKD